MAVHEDTFEAVMTAIKETAGKMGQSGLHEGLQAAALRDLAAAYRHLRGGAQPGGVHVEK